MLAYLTVMVITNIDIVCFDKQYKPQPFYGELSIKRTGVVQKQTKFHIPSISDKLVRMYYVNAERGTCIIVSVH